MSLEGLARHLNEQKESACACRQDQDAPRPVHLRRLTKGPCSYFCVRNERISAVPQAPAERACTKFAAGASVAGIQAVNPRPIKRSTIVSYIATAAANSSDGVDFGRLVEEAGLTYQTAAAIASGKAHAPCCCVCWDINSNISAA